MKFALLAGGGLGDCVWQYTHDEDWLKAADVKRKTGAEICVYVHSNNSQSVELFRHHPVITEVYKEPYMQPVARDIPPLRACNLNDFRSEIMPFYLSPDEQNIADLTGFVAFHPFAGEPHRSFPDQAPRIIDQLIDRGHTVVALGGDSYRRDAPLLESLNYERPGLVNLVGKAGVRLSLEMVKKCDWFLGTHSCYLTAAWCYGKRTLCIAPDALMTYLVPHNGFTLNKRYIDCLFQAGNHLVLSQQFSEIGRFMDLFTAKPERGKITQTPGVSHESGSHPC